MTNRLFRLLNSQASFLLAALLNLFIAPSAFSLTSLDVEPRSLTLTAEESDDMAQKWADELAFHKQKLIDTFNTISFFKL